MSEIVVAMVARNLGGRMDMEGRHEMVCPILVAKPCHLAGLSEKGLYKYMYIYIYISLI